MANDRKSRRVTGRTRHLIALWTRLSARRKRAEALVKKLRGREAALLNELRHVPPRILAHHLAAGLELPLDDRWRTRLRLRIYKARERARDRLHDQTEAQGGTETGSATERPTE